MVAGSPARPVKVPAGTSRRSAGSPAAAPAAISAKPPGTALGSGRERQASQQHRRARRDEDAIGYPVLLGPGPPGLLGRPEPDEGGYGDAPGHGDHRHQAQENPPPAEQAGHFGGYRGPGQPRRDPGRGQYRHHAGLQPGRQAAADDRVGYRRRRSGAHALQYPARDQHFHRGGQARHGQADAEQHNAGHERHRGSSPVGLPAGHHDADHAAQHEPAEDPAVKAQAAQVPGHDRHDRHHRQRLRRHEGDGQDQPDDQRPPLRRQQPATLALGHQFVLRPLRSEPKRAAGPRLRAERVRGPRARGSCRQAGSSSRKPTFMVTWK